MHSLSLTSLRFVFWVYLVLVLWQSTVQSFYAYRSTRRSRARGPRPPAGGRWPSVDVLIPCYNEDPEVLAACCESIERQSYQGQLAVWLVDDGSANTAELEPVYRALERLPAWTVERHKSNQGKRYAQASGFWQGTGEFVLTVDSDTVIAPDGVRRLVAAANARDVGAVTGNVGVLNASATWLTRLIQTRYRLLCEQERAAQSFHGAVLCCAGPFSLYRRAALQEVWASYLEQTIRGRLCTHGDDNHLTNLVLASGYRTIYERRAAAYTNVPTSVREFTRQQLRWNRTFYRELLWTVPNLWRRRRFYLAWDVTARLLLPLLLVLATTICVGTALPPGHEALYQYFDRLAAMVIVHAIFVTVQTKDPTFLPYGAIYVLLLLPLRLHALATLWDRDWMTRGVGSEQAVLTVE
jgi:N-acetylglucosaminyltransferase